MPASRVGPGPAASDAPGLGDPDGGPGDEGDPYLDQHQARLVAVLDAMAEGLAEMDASGRVRFANRSAQQMLGLTWDAIKGLTPAESGWTFLFEDGSPRDATTLPAYRVLAGGPPERDQLVGVRNAAGETWWLLVSSVPQVADGRVTGVVNTFVDVTERQEAFAAARARERRLRAAQALTGLAWWELNLTTGHHTWSDEMFRLVGVEPRAQAPTMDEYLDFIHPDDRDRAVDLLRQGVGSGHREVFRVVTPTGEVRHLQSWTEVERDGNSRPIKVSGATIDVSERERLLASIANGRARLAAALELTSAATWEWDVAADQVTWSTRMLELMGRDPNAPPPHVADFLACVHPDDRARMKDLGERTVSTGQPEEAVYRVVHADGSVRHVRAWTDVRRAPDGSVTHLWGTAMDITAEEEQTARLRAGEEYFRVAFDNAPIGMSLIGLAGANKGRYLRTNESFQAMLGRTAEEIAGAPIEELTHAADVERDKGMFAQLAAKHTDQIAFEKRYRHRDGHIVHAWLTSTAVYGADGEPLFLLTHAVDLSEQLRRQAELERLALTDTLTGLANRTLLNDRLDHALARLQRTGQAVGMLLLDVDRFKTVNDSLGHQIGDALLVEMAGRIEAVSRADSTVARLGGDEFVVLIEGLTSPEGVHAVAQRLLATIRRPYNLGPTAESLVATASIGVAVATDPGRAPGDLYREADLALYRAKDAGRDQYALFDDQLRARADRRMSAETLLRKALSEDLLVPVYQPIVDLADGRVHAAEALARIRNGDQLVLPADFIDVAEETGLIVEVDARMFEKVAAEGSRLLDAGVLLRRLTANVSARSLEDRSLVDRMSKALTWYGVPGSMIRLELTERSLLAASPAVRESLAMISDLGIHIGLDDFGTGYSALSYLQDLDLQFLKIDRSFISRLGTSQRDDAVVSAVVDLAHAHDLLVVAEGVETAEQLAALREMGCDRAQGYLMGRPMPAASLDDLLRTDPRW